MVNRKIKQHYVPQFYLRNFSIGRKGVQVYFFDKSKCISNVANIDRVACEKLFYDYGAEDRNQIIENELANRLEPKLKKAYSKLIKECSISCLTEADKQLIAIFIALQQVRTKEVRMVIKDMILQMTQKLSERYSSSELDIWIANSRTDDLIKTVHLLLMTDLYEYADIVNNKKWILFVNKTIMPFWCSDNPVTRLNPTDQGFGLKSPNIQISIPLNPEISLCFGEPMLYLSLPDRINADIEEVTGQNHLQVEQSTRFVYSNKNDFALAVNLLNQSPLLGDINRLRGFLR